MKVLRRPLGKTKKKSFVMNEIYKFSNKGFRTRKKKKHVYIIDSENQYKNFFLRGGGKGGWIIL